MEWKFQRTQKNQKTTRKYQLPTVTQTITVEIGTNSLSKSEDKVDRLPAHLSDFFCPKDNHFSSHYFVKKHAF